MKREIIEQIFKKAIPNIEESFGDTVAFDRCRLIKQDDKFVGVESTYKFTDSSLDREIKFNEYSAVFDMYFSSNTEEEFIEDLSSVNIAQYLIDWIKHQATRKASYMYHYIHSNYGSFHNWNKKRKIKILKCQ